jgi:ribosomal protein S30
MHVFLQTIENKTVIKKGGKLMAKRTKKNDPQQKNKKGFDSAVLNAEFAHEMGSADTNKIHKDKAKKEKAPKNDGDYHI